MESKQQESQSHPIRDILFTPLGCFLQITNPLVFAIASLLIIALISLLFPGTITNLLAGITGKPPQFLQNYQIIQYDDKEDPYWQITYQYDHTTTFSGTVRHSSVINALSFPMLSHDILITSGEFADASLVYTSVSNHHFRWSTNMSTKPEGRINLLHTVPATPEIEAALNRIKKGDQVVITGWEISRISKMVNDKETTYWHDSGCNTILVTSAEILEP